MLWTLFSCPILVSFIFLCFWPMVLWLFCSSWISCMSIFKWYLCAVIGKLQLFHLGFLCHI
jgi:hypothetical protein